MAIFSFITGYQFRKYLSGLLLVNIVASGFLYFRYNYPLIVIFYHFLVIGGIYLLFSGFIFFSGYLQNHRLRSLFRNLACFLFFFIVVLFYVVTIGSIQLWGKAIESRLLINYIFSLGGLITVLPLHPLIAYLFAGGGFILIAAVYWLIRPGENKLDVHSLKRNIVVSAILLLILLSLYSPLIKLKRIIYNSGEPVLSFIFPRSFDSNDDMKYFGDILVRGNDDKSCIAAVSAEPVHQTDRNFILIVLDDLRRDHLSAYGYQRKTSPFLDSMVKANDLLKIDYPFSTGNYTLTGMAGLFASKEMDHFSFSGLRLMRYMKLKKYKTYAFVSGSQSLWYWLADLYKNDCDVFFESKSSLTLDDDDFVTVNQFVATPLDRPFFLYFHLNSIHLVGKKFDEFKRFLPDKVGLGTDKKEAITNNYDNGVLQADFLVRIIFDRLRAEGLLEKTTIFITSDHGELFGEDNRFYHAGNVNPYLFNIPLFIFDKDADLYKNNFSASLLDVAPTIADRMGYPVPDCWEGTSLLHPLQDFRIQIQGSLPGDFPYGILQNKDSIITMEVLDKDRIPSRYFRMNNSDGGWQEVK